MRLLLVEDDKRFGLVLKHELEDEAHQVDFAPDGVEAVLDFMDFRYDIVLLDVRMPRLSGIDALRIIRRMDPKVPAIVFSASGRTAELEKAEMAGELQFLSKPFEIADLKYEITKLTAGNGPLAVARED